MSLSVDICRFDEDSFVEEQVREVVDDVWQSVSGEITNIWLRSIESPLVADIAIHKLFHLVHLATVEHDGIVAPKQTLEVLIPDEEPVPSSIDNWARGAVPARIVKASEGRFNGEGASEGTRTPSVSSFRSSSTKSRTTASRSVASRGPTRQGSTNMDNPPGIVELEDEHSQFGSDSANMNGTGHLYDMLQRQKNRLKQLTHTDETVKDEFQLLQEEVNRAAEDLKGKNYIFDQSGNVVLIQPLKSDQLPPFSFHPSLNVNNFDVDGDDKKRGFNKKKKKIRVAGSRSVEDRSDKSLFIPTTSLATTIVSNSNDFQLNNGVAIETNTISKEGPPIPEDPRKPSRKDYFKKKTNFSSTFDSSQLSWEDQLSPGNNTSPLMTTEITEMSKSSTFTGGNRFKDVDPLEGGRVKQRESTSVSPTRVPVAPTTDEAPRKQGRQQPALEPTKPSAAQQSTVNLLHGGSHKQGPRDRLASQILNTRAEKKRYVVPARGLEHGGDAQSSALSSVNSALKSGTIKKERVAREIF